MNATGAGVFCIDCRTPLKKKGSKRCPSCNLSHVGRRYGSINFRESGDLLRTRAGHTIKQKAMLGKLCDELWGKKKGGASL